MAEFTTRDGTQIFYKDWGTGEPIVFSHGWPLSADDWDAQMMFFLNQGYRVIAHDRRGHGRSGKPECCYTRVDFAYDLKLLLDALHIERADIVGHSLGSIVAPMTPAEYGKVVVTETERWGKIIRAAGIKAE